MGAPVQQTLATDIACFFSDRSHYAPVCQHRTANGRFAIGGEELKPYDLGVNVLVFALTQEGSLARRLVAAE